MFNDIFEGKTYSCTHTTDGSICEECLGGLGEKAKWEKDFEDSYRGIISEEMIENGKLHYRNMLAEAERREREKHYHELWALRENIIAYIKVLKKEYENNEEIVNLLDRILGELPMENAPIGVSQWRTIGEKYGYWDYFVEQEVEKWKTAIMYNVDAETWERIRTAKHQLDKPNE